MYQTPSDRPLMLEPQSTVLFVLLIVMFGGLMWWLVTTRRTVFRLVAACLGFVVAMQFGVLAVNKYFGYYQTWSAAAADLTNQGVSAAATVRESSLLAAGSTWPASFGQREVYLRLARRQGYTLRLRLRGPRSHLTRTTYVYLPPQYFQPGFARYQFPVIELVHGQPGEPQDWINVVGVQVTLDHLVLTGQARPAVLVMPDANGGNRVSLQCLNQVGGPQDLTFLARDVPQLIAHMLRVQPPGPAWGVAGYSAGGFCAANMALRFRRNYGFAAVMSGYFVPLKNQLANQARPVDPFRGNGSMRLANTPVAEVLALHPGAVLPQFWLGAGKDDKADVAAAEYFWQLLQLHQAAVPMVITPGGGHTMTTWRTEVPPMLAWMTKGLASVVAVQARKRAVLLSRHGRSVPGHP
jgi:enterochelin esterase-like enzyme